VNPVPTDSKSEFGATDAGGSLLVLALLAPIAGAGAGLVGVLFRLALQRADDLRNALIVWAHGGQLAGLLLVTAVSSGVVALAAWLVRRFSPAASGSGIPHVEAVLRGDLAEVPFRLIPIKFFGGLLAIGSGLALGREGPSLQMGANIGDFVGHVFRRRLRSRWSEWPHSSLASCAPLSPAWR
jgi:CIC family chloride channel protein